MVDLLESTSLWGWMDGKCPWLSHELHALSRNNYENFRGRTEAASDAEDVITNAVTTEYFSHEMPLMVDFMKQLTFGQVIHFWWT